MIKNKTKNTVIAKTSKSCNNELTKATGLMFSKRNPNLGLIFPFNRDISISIHMLFVFYPIDLIYLDKNKKVIEIKENLKPWGFYKPKNKARYLIEVIAGKVKESKTKVNDIVIFKN